MNGRHRLLTGALCFFLGLSLTGVYVTSAGLISRAIPLATPGEAYEVNPGPQGHLWVSDYGANEIRQVNPRTGVYTSYLGITNATDARRDASGDVWYTDYDENKLGRLSPQAQRVTVWELPGSTQLFGTAIDDAGGVWTTDVPASDEKKGHLYHFSPEIQVLCVYTLPVAGGGDYLLAGADGIWLGDRLGHNIWKLNQSGDEFTQWQLPADNEPQGTTLDDSGNLWWADSKIFGVGTLSQLEPENNRLVEYSLPIGERPEMVSAHDGRIWYTEGVLGTFGALDPSTAIGSESVLISNTYSVTPTCSPFLEADGVTFDVDANVVTGTWTTSAYTLTLDADGWEIYRLPEDAKPWGIAVQKNNLYIVDQGRQKLLEMFMEKTRVLLPLIRR